MDKPIAVGDLVVVNRVHCSGSIQHLGLIFRVKKVKLSGYGRCIACGAQNDEAAPFARKGRYGWYGYVKRIPPLEELEGQRTEENIREPA